MSETQPNAVDPAPRQPELQVPLALRDLINSASHQDSRWRPSTRTVVAVLEEVQRELSVEVAARMMFVLQQFDDPMGVEYNINSSGDRIAGGMSGSGVSTGIHRFTGTLAADRMVDRKYVSSPVECNRMGNAFMDAGLLHHVAHSRRFESSDELYFFDSAAALFRDSIGESDGDLVLGRLDELPGQPRHRASVAPDANADSGGIPTPASAHATPRQSSRGHAPPDNTQCSCRRLSQEPGVTSKPSVQSFFGLDSFQALKKRPAQTATVGNVVSIEGDAGHYVCGLVEGERTKARFAASA